MRIRETTIIMKLDDVILNLAKQIRRFLRDFRWRSIHDFGAVEDSFPENSAPVLTVPPNLDLAVLVLNQLGEISKAANVIISRDYPQGLISNLDNNLTTRNITWQRWDQKQWDGTRPWISSSDLLPEKKRIHDQSDIVGNGVFMSPYPASLFKLPLSFFLLEEVSSKRLDLSDIRRDLRKMLTVSSNQSTRNLLKLTHDNQRISAMNRRFKELGLGTIQIKGTDPKSGGSWNPGLISMSAMDTAKLLWLIQADKGSSSSWANTRNDKPAESKLNSHSKKLLLKHLGNQAFNETLSTANFGVGGTRSEDMGPPNVIPGIPNYVPGKWIDDITGAVIVNSDGEIIDYGEDVRSYNNDIANKRFLHKTGITYNFGSDAGIVDRNDGKDANRYIISFFSNLGYRYVDEVFSNRKSYPFYDDPGPIAHTQEIPRLGNNVDQLMSDLFKVQP